MKAFGVKQRSKQKLAVRLFLAILLISIGGYYFVASAWPADPVINGKRLSVWCKSLDPNSDPNMGTQAAKAMEAAGTNSFPYLFWMLQAKNSPTVRLALWMNSRIPFVKLPVTSAETFHGRAIRAFHILGPSTIDLAIDELSPLLELPHCAVAVTFVLGKGSDKVVLAFLKSLTNGTPEIRVASALELGYRRHPSSILPLINQLKDKSPQVRLWSANALARFLDKPELVIPALVEALNDKDLSVVSMAASSLGGFGASASNAVPRLVQLIQNETGVGSARLALTKISKPDAERLGKVVVSVSDQYE